MCVARPLVTRGGERKHIVTSLVPPGVQALAYHRNHYAVNYGVKPFPVAFAACH